MEERSNVESLEAKDEIDENSEIFAPLRALETALDHRIRVSTSRIQLRRNVPGSAQFVGIEGPSDEETLIFLEESVSDIIAWSDHYVETENTKDDLSRSSEGQTSNVLINHEISEQPIEDSSNGASTTISRSFQGQSTPITPQATSTTSGGSFFSIPSCTSNFSGIINEASLRDAQEAITDLEANGPAGLVHLSCLSEAVGKPLRVWCSGNENSRKIGRTRTGEAVDIEYHEPESDESQGHWTLRGNREPCDDVQGQLNDCLFSVVADQTGGLAPELRAKTLRCMRKNVKSLAKRIETLAAQEKCDRISLFVGGARYNGQRPQDAARIIDNSQQGQCHPSGYYGHPRGHASHPGATGQTDSAENYSRTGWKSAFLSRADQDAVGHLVLETREAQNAMDRLNRGETNIGLHVSPGALAPGSLPQGVEFYGGTQQGAPRNIKDFVIVLRHYQGQQNNPEADVFVHTFYPVLQ